MQPQAALPFLPMPQGPPEHHCAPGCPRPPTASVRHIELRGPPEAFTQSTSILSSLHHAARGEEPRMGWTRGSSVAETQLEERAQVLGPLCLSLVFPRRAQGRRQQARVPGLDSRLVCAFWAVLLDGGPRHGHCRHSSARGRGGCAGWKGTLLPEPSTDLGVHCLPGQSLPLVTPDGRWSKAVSRTSSAAPQSPDGSTATTAGAWPSWP